MDARMIMKAGDEVREIPLGADTVDIGRAEENAVTILDPKSSRKHCSVMADGGGFVVVDHDSRNGTQVNGDKISRHALREGDVIAIGKTNFIYHGPDAGEFDDAGAGDDGPVAEKWVLELETPDGASRTVNLEAKTTIGRNPKNTISIQDSKASNFHCEIVRDGPGYKVRDLNSTNGTRVDGKLVEDLDLYHGSVISIGKTLFTIRNLAIPTSEPGFETGPVGGPEFATFSKKRRSFPFGLLAALVLVAGGLYLLNFLAVQQVKTTEFANPAGNLLSENYSFEGTTDTRGFPIGFRSLESEGDTLSAETGGARTGKKSLLLAKEAGADPAAEIAVLYGEEINVAPGKTYELSAWMRPSELKGVCGAKIVWLSRKDPTFRLESYSNLLTGETGEFTQVKVRAAAPLGASRAEAVCFLKGREGSALLDDMEFREAAAQEDLVLKGERLDVRVGRRGLFTIRRSGGLRDIVRDGQLLLIEGGGKAWQRYCVMDEGFPKKSEGGIEIRGKIHSFASGKWIPFRESLTLSKGQITVAYEVEEAGDVALAGIAFLPEAEEIAEGVGIVSGSAYEVKTGGFESDGVLRMRWGQSTRPVSFNYDPPVNCMQVREEQQVLLLQLVPREKDAASIRLSVEVQTNFKAVTAEIREALASAREAESEGRPGEAVKHLKPVLRKYPFMKIESKSGRKPKGEKTGAEWLERLENEAFGEAEKIRTRFEVAQFFQNLREMEACLGDAKNFLAKYAGSSEEKELAEMAERIRLAIQDNRVRVGQQEAAGFLNRAREHRDRGEPALAALLYDHIARTWPGTEWGKAADEEKKKIKGE